MKTYWIVLSECTSFKKHRAIFYKRGPLIQGHKIGCTRLEHLLNFTLRYGYSLWYDQRDGIKNRTAAKTA